MNDPTAQPLDIEEQRRWIIGHKADLGSAGSWNEIGKRIGISGSSLSLFSTGKYNGPENRFAEAIYRYRQTLATQAAIRVEAPEIPGYFETETSRKLTNLLAWAHRGRLVTAALGAGIGKTSTAEHYKACNANVCMLTLSPSTSSVTSMLQALLWSLGDIDFYGNKASLSRRAKTQLRDRPGSLVIVDEAQHAKVDGLEELRHLHDTVGVGLALFGNERVQQQLEGGSRQAAFAQLFSRQSLKLTRSYALDSDLDALLDAWNVGDEDVRRFVREIGKQPGALRGATFTLELGTMLAQSEKSPLAVGHVKDAWAQLSSRASA